MARTTLTGEFFLKFYGQQKEKAVEGNHILLNEVLRFGDETTKETYEKGKEEDWLKIFIQKNMLCMHNFLIF